jgi:hypothetical protein
MIKLSEIEKIQSKWGNGIVKIGSLKSDRKACEKATIEMLNELYAFDLGDVLFKPTKAEKKQFRLELDGAKSYFVGGNIKFDEDKGFALLPWQSVKFENASVVLNKSHALAMGNYFFTDSSGIAVKVEYTFGYIRTNNGALKVNLHHSSLPYKND